MAKVEEVVADDRTSKGFAFSKTKINVVCPWHGYEFDIRTGRHHGNPRYRLKPLKVRVEGADVIVSLPEEKKRQNVNVQPTPDGRATRPEFLFRVFVMPGLVPGISLGLALWLEMAGSRPAMTTLRVVTSVRAWRGCVAGSAGAC